MNHHTQPIGIAVAGCGYWGINYVRLFQELPGASLIGVFDIRPERVDLVRQRFPTTATFPSMEALLADPRVEAVAICTEAMSHYATAGECLRRAKHVLVEKPLTTKVSDAEDLCQVAERNGRVLMVGHTFVYNAAVRKLRQYVVEDKEHLYYLYAQRTNLGPIRRDVNALWDLATHDISIFNYLLDETPEWVSAVGARVLGNGREDVGFITLGYASGRLGHIHVSWADPNKTRQVVAVFGDKRIVFDDLNGLEQVRVFEKGIRPITNEPPLGFGEYKMQIRDGDIISPKIEPREPLKDQCCHFLECINSGDKPLTGGPEGIDVLVVLEAMDRSVALRGARVEVRQLKVLATPTATAA